MLNKFGSMLLENNRKTDSHGFFIWNLFIGR